IESNAKRYDAMNKGIFKDLTKHNDVISPDCLLLPEDNLLFYL
ncbi:hypothetical protein ACUOA5_28440, partial [Escherichia coli]